jgi:hypothetical protein
MRTAEIVTDAGHAYIKALGNPEGSHALACELVGTSLAGAFGLRTFEHAIMQVDAVDEIHLGDGLRAKPGPAFVAKAERGHSWSGVTQDLEALDNPEDVTRLVVFDTWTLNADRCPPADLVRKPNLDNVFLSTARGRPCLLAIDHTHCFTRGRELTKRVADIDLIKDQRIWGLFPGFVPKMRRDVAEGAAADLGKLDEGVVQNIVASIPRDWEVGSDVRAALVALIMGRARFLSETVCGLLAPRCWPQQKLDLEQGSAS